VTINDPTGLHARPAVKLSRLAKTFKASIEVSVSEQGVWVDAKSTNSLMKMKALSGSELVIRANGRDAECAVSEMIKLIKNDFRVP
jgi:phosphocarrier protein